MRINAERGNPFDSEVDTLVELRRNVPNWSNFLIIEVLLLIFPFIYWWQRVTFEAQRWSGSDYPEETPAEKIVSALTENE